MHFPIHFARRAHEYPITLKLGYAGVAHKGGGYAGVGLVQV